MLGEASWGPVSGPQIRRLAWRKQPLRVNWLLSHRQDSFKLLTVGFNHFNCKIRGSSNRACVSLVVGNWPKRWPELGSLCFHLPLK